ncbi:hypothetical protein [Luteimonas vadosa]|uniref:hypothetical protein n=1 Tax=Luteimonas vadosa TaxID=1165507 RepID=UPI0031EC5D23
MRRPRKAWSLGGPAFRSWQPQEADMDARLPAIGGMSTQAGTELASPPVPVE